MATPILPNPLTPLAWLEPNVARQVENARYILAATAGAWVWDVLMSLADLVRISSVSNLKAFDVAHVVSRVMTGTYIFTTLMLFVTAVPDCNGLAKAVGWVGAVTLPIQTVPFFFCGRAVFSDKKWAVAIFALFLAGTVGGGIATPFFIHAEHIGETSFCIVTATQEYAAGITTVAVNNLIIFVSVSLHLILFTDSETWPGRLEGFFTKSGMGHTSKLLLRNGQAYLIPVVTFNIVAAVTSLIPSMPSSYRLVFIILNVSIQSSMTARIHRRIKSGLMSVHPTSTSGMDRTIEFRGPSTSNTHGQRGSSMPNIRSGGLEASLQPVVVSIPTSTSSSGPADEKVVDLETIHEENKSRADSDDMV